MPRGQQKKGREDKKPKRAVGRIKPVSAYAAGQAVKGPSALKIRNK